ncbi:MAG: GTPase [Pseudomonas profundi]|uniref:GTPase n=1 Tax=Pseudomonas profundi TaxID=1981513 RepID=UPI0030017986
MRQLADIYLPEARELVNQLQVTSAVTAKQLNVAVYGVYNAGKSSLLNSLTGHVECEFFATSDVPQTKVNSSLVQDGIRYVDTPGLDVNEQDTRMATEGSYQADLLLLVHKLGAGSVQSRDLRAMARLVQAHGKPDCILTVLTEGELARDNQPLLEEITAQIRSFLPGCSPYIVSNSMFRKGVLEEKQLLVELSGIPQLLQVLQEAELRLGNMLEQERNEKKHMLKVRILEHIAERQRMLEDQLEAAARGQATREQCFVEAVQELQSNLGFTRQQGTGRQDP